MKLKSIITISGRICSGKSFAANLIKDEFGFPVASFGGYLKNYCEKSNLPIDRETLQNVGEAFIKTEPDKFLINVISFSIGHANRIIIEGVRHKSIFNAVNQLAEAHMAIFLDARLEVRYERYSKRNKDSDKVKTFEQFVLFDNHTVELEIESLKNHCDITIDSTKDYSSELLSYLHTNLKNLD